MTTTAVHDVGNADATAAAAANAGAGTHRQSDGDDVEARLAGVKALLDQNARTLKTLHGASFCVFLFCFSVARPIHHREPDVTPSRSSPLSPSTPPKAKTHTCPSNSNLLPAAVVLSGGRPPAQAELDLAAEARETLAAAARALPPRALLGGGGGGVRGGAGGVAVGEANRDDADRLARLATVERTVQNLGMLPPPVPVAVAAATAAAAAAGAPPPASARPLPPPPPRQQ